MSISRECHPHSQLKWSVTPAKNAGRSRSAKKKALPLMIHPPPTPINGHTYGVGEFCHYISKLQRASQRSHSMNQVTNPPYRYVKKKKTAIYDVLWIYKQGHAFAFGELWKDVGRKPLLNNAEVDWYARVLASSSAEKIYYIGREGKK